MHKELNSVKSDLIIPNRYQKKAPVTIYVGIRVTYCRPKAYIGAVMKFFTMSDILSSATICANMCRIYYRPTL